MILGLTGGIASGKSLVSSYLNSLGFPVIDADVVSREVVEPGTKGLQNVAEQFGQDILQKDGSLDRAKLGSLVFADENNRKILNDILHPIIWKKTDDYLKTYKSQGHDLIVMDIPLLFEGNNTDYYDHIMVVYVPANIQLERLMARNNLSEEDALNRIHSQMSLEKKSELADTVIDNSGSIEETYQQIDTWLSRFGIVK